jgi:hypothetical protein
MLDLGSSLLQDPETEKATISDIHRRELARSEIITAV